MTTLIICLLIAVILPYLVRLPVGNAMNKAPGGYNNNLPRVQQDSLEGYGARAAGAHYNCFESLLVFAVAVLTAIATHHVSRTVQILAVIYILSRFVYIFLYLGNFASLRSLVWFIGFVCCISILCLCF